MASEVTPVLAADESYEAELDKRIDLARLGFYRQIGRTASELNFYFESVFNLFIAVTQVPLSFAVHRREAGELRLAFHMCTDKKHQRWFEGLLSSKVFEGGRNCFPLFPKVLDGEYCVSVWIMHTKSPLRGDLTTLVPFPGDSDWGTLSAEHDPWTFRYVADCAKKFFSDNWDGFATDFASLIGPALRNSLQKLEQNHAWLATWDEDRARGASWPPNTAAQIAAQRSFTHPNSEKDDWHHHISKTLGPTLRAFEFGTNAISSLLWNSGNGPSDSESKAEAEIGINANIDNNTVGNSGVEAGIENILLMYRAFDRDVEENDKGRHATKDGAYPYNVRMLLPNSNDAPNSKPIEFFRALKNQDLAHGREKAVGGENWLYDSIVERPDLSRSSEESVLRYIVILALDNWFWRTLRQEDGPDRLVEILSSPVGNASRSVADPVFNTGLIHYNPIFEFGGLDRVQLDQLPSEFSSVASSFLENENRDSLSDSVFLPLVDQLEQCGGVCKDIKRIVTFFYFASAMLKGGSNRSQAISTKYSARNMAAILMPVKVRGSVWAVSLHVTLVDPQGPRHLHSWMANFFLMTNQLELVNFVIDRALWDNLERRVTDVLAHEIGRAATPREGGFEGLEASLRRVNESLAGENRLVPFVLPRFTVNWDAATRSVSNSIRLFPSKTSKSIGEVELDLVLDVEWQVEPNPFFVARQEWTGRTSRSLEPAISLGLDHGLRELAALRREVLSGPVRDRMN
ncbi:hypothetical protein [Salipiger sp.]|uniref:hypothetical protein n=1 Tax=Salipiger sp. TaxID=2078585 RepID=UPI003A96E31C